MEIGTDPDEVNTDGDGRDDGCEHVNRDAGFDPLVPTEEMSTGDYVGHFVLGATCGELFGGFCEKDSLAWLSGNIAGGFFVVTDIRDAIGNVFRGEFVGVGINVLEPRAARGRRRLGRGQDREVRPPRVGPGRRDAADVHEDRRHAAVGQAPAARDAATAEWAACAGGRADDDAISSRPRASTSGCSTTRLGGCARRAATAS